MKTTHTHNHRKAAANVPARPVTPNTSPRAARKGSFWPGEAFALVPRRNELATALAGAAFVLPQIASGHFPK